MNTDKISMRAEADGVRRLRVNKSGEKNARRYMRMRRTDRERWQVVAGVGRNKMHIRTGERSATGSSAGGKRMMKTMRREMGRVVGYVVPLKCLPRLVALTSVCIQNPRAREDD